MHFSKDDIARYYDLSEIHYRRFWDLDRSRSLHYGYWDSSTKNFHEALLNLNKVLAAKVSVSNDDVVLDAGCGVGGSCIWLAKNIGCRATGISLNARQVEKAKDIALQEGIRHLVNFREKDYTNTGFADASFNVVWAVESVCYVPDKAEFITEAFRLLKPGGRLVIADFFKKEGLHGKDEKLVQRWAHGWAIEDYATKENFQEQLIEAGFTNIHFENANAAIMPSAKRLYRAYFAGIIPSLLYRLFNRNTTKLAKKNVDTAYLQYKTLKKNLWCYGIVWAKKN